MGGGVATLILKLVRTIFILSRYIRMLIIRTLHDEQAFECFIRITVLMCSYCIFSKLFYGVENVNVKLVRTIFLLSRYIRTIIIRTFHEEYTFECFIRLILLMCLLRFEKIILVS